MVMGIEMIRVVMMVMINDKCVVDDDDDDHNNDDEMTYMIISLIQRVLPILMIMLLRT